MITTIETLVASHLAAFATSANLAFTFGARASTSKEVLPKDRPMIFAQIEDLPQEVPGKDLWIGHLQVWVSTPVDVKSITIAQHTRLEILATAAFDENQKSVLAALFDADESGIKCPSFARTGWKPARQETSWTPHLAVTLAIRL